MSWEEYARSYRDQPLEKRRKIYEGMSQEEQWALTAALNQLPTPDPETVFETASHGSEEVECEEGEPEELVASSPKWPWVLIGIVVVAFIWICSSGDTKFKISKQFAFGYHMDLVNRIKDVSQEFEHVKTRVGVFQGQPIIAVHMLFRASDRPMEIYAWYSFEGEFIGFKTDMETFQADSDIRWAIAGNLENELDLGRWEYETP
jgi:hypothetical protein